MSTFGIFEILRYENILFLRDPHEFLVCFEVFWYNKINKYGAPRLRKSEVMEFRYFDVLNNEICISLDQSEAEEIYKAFEPIPILVPRLAARPLMANPTHT